MKLMWKVTLLVWLLLTAASIAVGQSHALAAPTMAAPAGLSLLEMKITGDEFLIIQNNSGNPISDLSSYWLTVYNSTNPLAAAVSSSTQQLPAAGLLPGQTLLLSASPLNTCGAAVAGKLSLSLTDSGGYLQLAKSTLDSKGSLVQTPVDVVSWSSSAGSGIIPSVPSSTKDAKAVYYRYLNGNSYVWQLADSDPSVSCQLNIVVAGGSGSPTAVTPLTLAATSPPATILGTVSAASDSDTVAASLPPTDIGLNAPQISELLPNPNGTGNDDTDEFIELYNPNGVAFDLSGFILQTGLTGSHSYPFPSGTVLPASSFKAFYSADTGLTLSNTSGQANLLDPLGNSVSTTAAYGTAKDGLGWALAKGNWYWTTQPTPGLANVIKQPVSKKAKAAAAKKKGAKKSTTAKRKKTTKLAASTDSSKDDDGDAAGDLQTPIHTRVLAAVIAAALLYGLYEYRRDIGNRLRQLKRQLAPRRADRPQPARPGDD